MSKTNRKYQVIYGHPDTPKDEWEVVQNLLTYPPDYIQELFVRRENVLLEIAEKYADKPETYKGYEIPFGIRHGVNFNHVGWRYSMRPVPVDQDYVARMAARTDYVEFDRKSEVWQYPEMIGHRILFYATEQDAMKDKRTDMSFQKYMRTVVRVDEEYMEHYCSMYNIPYADDVTLHWARTAEEIAMVYRDGPRSCMSGDNIGNQLEVQAYAVDPIAVAYLMREESIVARTVVNTSNKKYVRIYGDRNRLRSLLTAEEYEQSDYALAGCHLRVMKHPDPKDEDQREREYTPYLDGSVYIDTKTECGTMYLVQRNSNW